MADTILGMGRPWQVLHLPLMSPSFADVRIQTSRRPATDEEKASTAISGLAQDYWPEYVCKEFCEHDSHVFQA